MFKLRPTIAYKKENETTGFLFSIGDDSNQLLRVSGLVNDIAQKLAEGHEISRIKTQILDEYDVSDEQLSKDIEAFRSKLLELGWAV